MKRAALLIGALWVFFAWTAAASFLLCWGLDRLDLFTFPYTQWLDLAGCWSCMTWWPHGAEQWRTHPLFWFLLAGVLPTALLASGVWSWWRFVPPASVYGDSQWAGDSDLAGAGITFRNR